MSRKKYSLAPVLDTTNRNFNVQFSSKEISALNEFKARISDLIKPDHDEIYLSKWLRARSWDVNRAEEMYRASMLYRERMNLDQLLQTYKPPEVLEKYFPDGFCGYDTEGSPILVELLGKMDLKGLIHSARKVDIEKTKLVQGEQIVQMLSEQSKKLGKLVEGITIIIDMEDVGSSFLWGPGMQMYVHMGKVLQDNYPEVVKRSFLINAPRIFPLLWSIVRPLVTEEMKKKVSILGGSYKEELLQHIDADQLPAFLGGNMTGPDGNPRCPHKIPQGGDVPEKYYLTDLLDTSRLQSKTVAHGEKLEIKINIDAPQTVIRWEFKTDGYDIGFGVMHQDNVVGQKTEILPVERVNSHLIPEDGCHTCLKTGTYIALFDNTYSWARSKTLYYNLDIVEADRSAENDLNHITQGGSWSQVSTQHDDAEVTKL